MCVSLLVFVGWLLGAIYYLFCEDRTQPSKGKQYLFCLPSQRSVLPFGKQEANGQYVDQQKFKKITRRSR